MIYPLVRELAVDGVPVAVTCRVLGFSRQAFYAWDANPVSDRDWDDAHLVNAILDVHGDDPEFGYRFIADELAADPGVVDASENRIWRLCRENGVASVISKRTGSGKTPGPAVHDDHVQRQFTADAANQLWLTDSVASLLPNRTPHRRGQALPVRSQGLLLQPDRGLLHRLPDEGLPRGRGPDHGNPTPAPQPWAGGT